MILFITIVLCLIMLNVTSQIAKGNRTLAWQIDLAQNSSYEHEIYSIIGKKMLSGKNSNIDVSALKGGGDILIIEGKKPIRFIKD